MIDKSLYPYRSNWLEIDGNRYHYLDEGPKNADAIVMVHGNPTWSFYYRTLIAPLSRDWRVVVPDHIGCGLSDKPQDYPYTIERHSENLHRLVSHLGLRRIVWVVHDWGGAIGVGCACRLYEHTLGFVIFNTAAFTMAHIPLRIRLCRSNRLGGFFVRGLNLFAGMAVYFGTAQPRRFTSAVKAGYLHPYSDWKNRIAVHRFVQEIPIEDKHPTRRFVAELEKCLPRFADHPMRIFWGGKDFCFTRDEALVEWKRRFPKAEVTIFEDAGHYVVEDAHERILPPMRAFVQPLLSIR